MKYDAICLLVLLSMHLSYRVRQKMIDDLCLKRIHGIHESRYFYLDFFTGKDGENYVQEVHEGWANYLYRGTFREPGFKAMKVLSQWFEDMQAAQEKK